MCEREKERERNRERKIKREDSKEEGMRSELLVRARKHAHTKKRKNTMERKENN